MIKCSEKAHILSLFINLFSKYNNIRAFFFSFSIYCQTLFRVLLAGVLSAGVLSAGVLSTLRVVVLSIAGNPTNPT